MMRALSDCKQVSEEVKKFEKCQDRVAPDQIAIKQCLAV